MIKYTGTKQHERDCLLNQIDNINNLPKSIKLSMLSIFFLRMSNDKFNLLLNSTKES